MESNTVFKPNKRGKFEVLDMDDNIVSFDYAVDAKDALIAVDADGKPRFKPIPEKRAPKNLEEKVKQDAEDSQEGENLDKDSNEKVSADEKPKKETSRGRRPSADEKSRRETKVGEGDE